VLEVDLVVLQDQKVKILFSALLLQARAVVAGVALGLRLHQAVVLVVEAVIKAVERLETLAVFHHQKGIMAGREITQHHILQLVEVEVLAASAEQQQLQ
jgi:hypothetical protein